MGITEETRREAYYEAQNTAPTKRYEIYRLLKEGGPMSSEEIMERMRCGNPNCVRPRLTELKQAGLIETCGKTRSKYGNGHIAVWQVAEDKTSEAIPVHPVIDYSDLAEYVKSYPDKVAKWFAFRLVDDDMEEITREFYEVACAADYDGPAFEEWRKQ